jgi:cytochrome c-type biogenesis protein CcmH
VKRIIWALILCLSAVAMAADGDRYNNVGNKIQCSCGCAQMLLKCNHVGCPNSDGMIKQLRTALNNYANDEDVLNWFRRSYGVTVVVEPATHGFELTAWVVPPLLTGAAMLLVFFLIRRWRARAAPVAATNLDPQLEEFKLRARKETEL